MDIHIIAKIVFTVKKIIQKFILLFTDSKDGYLHLSPQYFFIHLKHYSVLNELKNFPVNKYIEI